MGQYFKLVNLDKKEQVITWNLKLKETDFFGAKFLEIYGSDGGFKDCLVWLLRKSDEGGGGDVDSDKYKWLGRWAGDRIVLIGDYDSSDLYSDSEKFADISKEVWQECQEDIK
ncbi:MAG: hypothetical protein WC955_05100 [Elusimicrobiota bacterium]